MASQDASHISVLLREVMEVLSPKDGGIYVDGTFGAGGYSRAILEAADCQVFGIDRDPLAISKGQKMADEFPGRLIMIEGCYADMEELLAGQGVAAVDGIALDIGVSSMQIDEAERGFSFMREGPLDMRMSGKGRTAAEIVNEESEAELARIIFVYGEERRSRAIARAVAERRELAPFKSTVELAEVVASVVRPTGKGIHPATRTFQALRIVVNDELGQLVKGLAASERLLTPGGRLAVVSFHSLEDRRVKNFLSARSEGRARPSRHVPVSDEGPAPTFKLIKRGTIKARPDELAVNPRSRSARLRGAIRTNASAWTEAA
ncbi:16S rRNA (cytosine(1402)-N(4))-methyltransferase RsmH [Sneathiella litorea]|uniref:Ribosomal RNA small subunit methyltransferase H n=1 Tax=Sneathiella litorea TaxID=2606216 RepID=A0A6L8WDQ1_9PROT|nr:16S rRNA (cytosine(1402)-N(4))-methyltransferase RsmH [Sneathiella litorea]MZR32492.1 16S rRNA (cytosine(1402)-N(4))-methyltransferase RsmH [Sneathiella litorea]